jgi:hypothetical protein
MLNFSGREYPLITSPGYEINLDLRNVDKGIYILKLYTEAGIITKKLIVN